MRSSNDYDDGDSSSTTSVYNKDEPTSVATAAGVSAAGGMPEPTTSILSGETETTTMINKTEEEEAAVLLTEKDLKVMLIKESRLRSAQLMRQAMLLAPDKKLKDAQEEKLVEFDDNLLENVADDDDDPDLLLIKMLKFEQQQLREFMTSVRIYQKQVKSLALSFDKDDSGGIPEPTSILFGETKTMTIIINKTEEEAAVLLEEKDFKAMIEDSRLRSAQLIMRQAMIFAQDKTLEDAQEKEKEKLVELENFLQDTADDDPDLQLIKMLEFEQRQLDIHECDVSHTLIGEVLSGAAPLKSVVEALNYPVKKTIQGIKSMTNFSINNKRR